MAVVMAIPNFEDYIKNNLIDIKYQNSDAAKVYDFLTMPESIGAMIHAVENGKAALSGVEEKLNSTYANLPQFNFLEDQAKQCVGRMIREILNCFGYATLKEKSIDGNYFKNAMQYIHK